MPRKITKLQFAKGLEEIRGTVQILLDAQTKPFPAGKKAQAARIARAARDPEYFGRTYFPHYVEAPNSALHRYLCERFQVLIFRAEESGEGDKEADAAPRGNAKSTWTDLIFVLWCEMFGCRKFALIVSDTATQAYDFVSFIQAELEMNQRLAQDFPEHCGEGPIWRTGTIITRKGMKIRGVGAGQKLRGMRHGARRPDLVIGDDLENDEAVESPEQRKKLERWFFKALMKIGQKDTVFIVIGTILHYDSLLSKLLNRPGWKGKKFQSVIKFSRSKLWEKWEEIFIDISVGKEAAEALADEFFAEHMEEMLAGTEVLWPDVEDYYYLMKMRISDGPAYFDSEKQNEPINPEDCLFKEEWFTFWEEDEVDLSGLPHYGAVDPSMGKKSKRHDPSAILGGRKKAGIIYLDIADIDKRHPDKIITDTLLYHEKDPFQQFGCEAIQFQELFADDLEKIAHEKNLTLNVVALKPNTDKHMRIQSLQPWIKNGWIRFKRNMYELIRQLKYYPAADHDDGPDALEQLKELIEKHAPVVMEYESPRQYREHTRLDGYFA